MKTGGDADPRPVAVWVEDTDVITFLISRYWRRCSDMMVGAADRISGVAFMREKKDGTTYQHVTAIVDHVRATFGEAHPDVLLDIQHRGVLGVLAPDDRGVGQAEEVTHHTAANTEGHSHAVPQRDGGRRLPHKSQRAGAARVAGSFRDPTIRSGHQSDGGWRS
eukprot:m.130129 g.130129  ORF g.130129 m.130129 type:complete len:164 (-) comp22365_c0_seq5:432-923(-)